MRSVKDLRKSSSSSTIEIRDLVGKSGLRVHRESSAEQRQSSMIADYLTHILTGDAVACCEALHDYVEGGSIPSASAIFTRSASDRAPIFRITWPRCVFTVTSVTSS